MSKLVSVEGDPNTDGNGALLADNNPNKFYINGKKVNLLNSHALPDDLCFPVGYPHCDPFATEASSKVFVAGIPVHRHDDSRICGAKTIVEGQSKVTVGA